MAAGLLAELRFKSSRSSGPGGQHVNKANTRVEVFFNPSLSRVLSQAQKELIQHNLAKWITASDEIIVSSQAHRSQYKNKQDCIEKLFSVLSRALKLREQRIKTGATFSSKLKRLEVKRHLSEKKRLRKKQGLL